MPSSATAAAGNKENVVGPDASKASTAAKPVRRGVGPRSGTKIAPPQVPGGSSSNVPPAPAPSPAPRKPARRSSSRVKVAPANTRGLTANAFSLCGGVTAALAPPKSAHTAIGKPQKQQKQKRSKPAALPSAPVPLFRAQHTLSKSGGGGSGGGGGGKRRKSASNIGEGAKAGQVKEQRRVWEVKDGNKRLKAKEKKEQGNARPAVAQSDFDFDLNDTDEDSSLVAAGPAAAANGKKAQGGGASGKNKRVKRTRASAGGREAKGDKGGGKRSSVAGVEANLVQTCAGIKSSVAEATIAFDVPSSGSASENTASPPRDASNERDGGGSGGGGEVGSPRGLWRVGALFGSSDDDVEEESGERDGRNWRLSDDDNEDEADLHKKSPRRPAGSGGTASGGKKRRASGGASSGGGGARDRDGGGDTKAERTGWADNLPPPVLANASTSSGEDSKRQSVGKQAEEAELEAIRARFRKVDSHRLSLSH